MSNCDLAPSVSRLLDGELEPEERTAVEAHLGGCASCGAAAAAWRAEGEALRGFFRRHALGDEFVERVRISISARAAAQTPAPPVPYWSAPALPRWAAIAAAVVAGVFLAAQLYRSRDDQALARVLEPGERLEMRSARSSTWTPMQAGASLRQGDWVRMVSPGRAELLLPDASKVTLRSGTLARLSSGGARVDVALLAGAVRSDVGPGSGGVAVRTEAGNVVTAPIGTASGERENATAARFEVKVQSLMLPELHVASDRAEHWSGSVEIIGRVAVDAGAVEVESGRGRHTIAAGGGAIFTPTRLAPMMASARGIEARLEAVQGGSAPRLSTTLTSDEHGLRIEVRVAEIALARLLEWVSDASVSGSPEMRVSGSLSYALDAEPEELARAVAGSVGLDIDLRNETAVRPTAAVPGPELERSPSERAFMLRRSEAGSLSFRFRGIPAGEVLRALRRAQVDAPYPSRGSESVPLDLEASDLDPSAVPAWLDRTLGLVRHDEEQTLRVAEVRSAAPRSLAEGSSARARRGEAGGVAAEPRSAPARESTDSPSASPGREPQHPSATTPRGIFEAPPARRSAPQGAVWGVLGRRPGAAPPAAAGFIRPAGESPAALRGRLLTSDEGEPLRSLRASRRLVWPAVTDETPDTIVYSLYNAGDGTASLAWNGYDASGRLVARLWTTIASATGVSIAAGRDLGVVLPSGAHWETVSDRPLAGAAGTGGKDAFYAFDPERLPRHWEFDAWQIEGLRGDSTLWIINPGAYAARIVVALVEQGSTRALASTELVLEGHGAALWSARGLGLTTAEIERLRRSGEIVIESLDAGIAAGAGNRAGGVELPGRDGDWVTTAPAPPR